MIMNFVTKYLANLVSSSLSASSQISIPQPNPSAGKTTEATSDFLENARDTHASAPTAIRSNMATDAAENAPSASQIFSSTLSPPLPLPPQAIPSKSAVITQSAGIELTQQTPVFSDKLAQTFTPVCRLTDEYQTSIIVLQSKVEKYNLSHPQPLKIKFYNNEKGEVTAFFGYTPYEYRTLLKFPDCQFLTRYFTIRRGNIFTNDYAVKIEYKNTNENVFNYIKNKYKKLVKCDANTITTDFPTFDNFTGSNEQIAEVFSSILAKHRGFFVGELHADKSPKTALCAQMPLLAQAGVKNLFLEFICHDTLQAELDDFFETKKPSKFLETFIKNGYGGALNLKSAILCKYWELIEAAVEAGIRPVGLERSATQMLGYDDYSGATSGPERMLGLNVGASEIINMYEGKFVALVGSGHVSYHHDIAGLSELCSAPNVIIEDRAATKCEFNLKNFNMEDSKEIEELFDNTNIDHIEHVVLQLIDPDAS